MAKNPRIVPLTSTTKTFYELLCITLEERGINPEEYKIHLQLLSERFRIYRYAQDILLKDGEFITQIGDQKQERMTFHPLTKVRDQAYKDIVQGLKEYGLTAKSKADLQMVNTEAQSAMEQLMAILNGGGDA
ncbi:P27 family phage terminase small subunit [Aeromonas dhakensis]|uniref:P27 family phage terminase small subunit n=1 Tax=Aeromonas dhakensis TaxID=196024 RepID=UPI0038B619A9